MTYEKVYLKKKTRLILHKLLLTMKCELNHQVQTTWSSSLLAKEQMQVKFVLT